MKETIVSEWPSRKEYHLYNVMQFLTGCNLMAGSYKNLDIDVANFKSKEVIIPENLG